MNKTTLKKMSRKELVNIAKEAGIADPMNITSSRLINEILVAKQIDSDGNPLPPRQLSQENENLEMRGGSKKFETQDQRSMSEPEYPVDETRELPPGYGDTKILAMTRDPYWAFVYWEINHEKRRELGMLQQHQLRMVLRVHDVSGIDFNGNNANKSFDIDVNDYTNNWYIQVPEPNRSYCVDLGVFDEKGNFILIARSNIFSTPRDTVSDQFDEEWRSLHDFDQIYRLSGGYKISEWAGSEMITKMLAKNLEESLSSGAVASSAMRPRKAEAGKDFWLVVNTELIVYGATEPDAAVTIQGHPIKLRPDGTFSVRFALPDGEQVIPVHATNADGDMEKQITPIVSKKTRVDIE